MKQILVIGEHSYIGTSFRDYMADCAPDVKITLTGARDGAWKQKDFSRYDAVLHAAAVVHKKEQPDMRQLYHEVNSLLPYQVAKKAKAEGVKHFLFLSTMAVYGEESGMIAAEASPKPVTLYGKSKLKAERGLKKLADESFRVSVFRPPMVYGPDCPGNYGKLARLANFLPVFPKVENKRSMIYIENLCECIRQKLLDETESFCVICPQDAEYVNTTELVREIRKAHGKHTWALPFLDRPIRLFAKKSSILGKVFGNCCYEKGESVRSYQVKNFCEAIQKTER